MNACQLRVPNHLSEFLNLREPKQRDKAGPRRLLYKFRDKTGGHTAVVSKFSTNRKSRTIHSKFLSFRLRLSMTACTSARKLSAVKKNMKPCNLMVNILCPYFCRISVWCPPQTLRPWYSVASMTVLITGMLLYRDANVTSDASIPTRNPRTKWMIMRKNSIQT